MTPADRPTTDHGAAGFCTDHGQAADRPTTASADQGAEGYDGPTVDHSTPGEAPPFPADRPTTVTREAVEAAWASWFPGTSGPWSVDFRWRLYKALADLGLAVTDTPTEEGAR